MYVCTYVRDECVRTNVCMYAFTLSKFHFLYFEYFLNDCFIYIPVISLLWSVGLADGGGCPDLLAGRAHAEIQLQVPLQDPAHHGGGGVPLGQPGAAQQAL